MGAYSDTLRLSMFFFLPSLHSLLIVYDHPQSYLWRCRATWHRTRHPRYQLYHIYHLNLLRSSIKTPNKNTVPFWSSLLHHQLLLRNPRILCGHPLAEIFISCAGAFIAGLSGGPLWVSQGRFIHLSCVKNKEVDKKGKMFGFFTTFYCFSNVSAGLLTTYALGFFDTRIYFCSIAACGVISILFCIFFIPNIDNT